MVPDGVRSSARVGEFGASPPFRPSFKGGRRMCARTSKRRRDGRATVSGATFSDLPDGGVLLTNHVTVRCPDKEGTEREIGEGISSGVPKTMENITMMAIIIEKICKFQ